MELTRKKIESLLPHRPPMLLLTRVVDLLPGDFARGIRRIAKTDPWLCNTGQGNRHFPHCMALEMVMQTAGVVCAAAAKEGSRAPAAGFLVDCAASFQGTIREGDLVESRASITRIWGRFIQGTGDVRIGERLVVECSYTLAGGPAPAGS